MVDDSTTVLYSYYCYNLNLPSSRNKDRIYDGEIEIQKSALVEPEIHVKIKKWPSGRKQKIIKRIPVDVPICELISEKKVQIKNSGYAWQLADGIDIVARSMCLEIFNEYQRKGKMPEVLFYKK